MFGPTLITYLFLPEHGSPVVVGKYDVVVVFAAVVFFWDVAHVGEGGQSQRL